MKRITCRLCDSSSLHVVADLNPLPLVDAYSKAPNTVPLYPCGLRMCADCGHIQLADVVNPSLLFEDYLFFTADYPWLVEHYRKYAASVYAEFRPAFVVEIGSNDGTLAKMFEEQGAHVLGVDPSNVPASVPTLPEYFTSTVAERIRVEHGPAHVMLANHVFAHVDDLKSVVEGIKLLLATDGVFVFEAGSGLDMLEEHYFDTVYHEHLDYHTVSPLVRFFKRMGLEMFRVEHNDSKGGTIRGYVSHAGRRDIEPSVTLAMEIEEACGATRPGVFREWNERLMQRRTSVLNQLNERHFVGYGAAAGGIATLHHLGLADRCLWLVDDSPRRHGMYAPHSNLLVKDTASLYGYDTHHGFTKIIILSWRYAEVIKLKHPNLEMIVP